MSVLAFLHGGTTGIYLFARLAIGLAVSSIMRNDLGSHVTICKKLKRKHRKAPETIIGQNVIWVKYMFNCVYLPRPEKRRQATRHKRRRALRLKRRSLVLPYHQKV
jgi:hypothetical protein